MAAESAGPDGPADRDAGRFWWFERASAVALAGRLVAALLSGTFRRLEVRIAHGAKGEPMTFRVVTTDDATGAKAAEPDINESWLCPPRCPD